MTSIDPISGDIPVTPLPASVEAGHSVEKEVLDGQPPAYPELYDVSPQKLRQDKKYFIEILTMFFRRARSELSGGNYEKAQRSLDLYFQYLHGEGHYWSDFQTQSWGIQRYSAIFWNALVINHLEGQRAQQAFTNKELLIDIHNALKNQQISKSEQLQSKEFINHLQQESRLPSSTNKAMDPSYKTLIKVSKFFRSHHMTETAQRVLLHAYIQQSINLSRVQQQMNNFSRPTSNEKLLFPLASHLFPFERTGLPFTTAQPYLQDPRPENTKGPQTVGLNYYTHNINRINPIHKDPDPDQQRRRQQQRRKNKISGPQPIDPISTPEEHPEHLETQSQSHNNIFKNHPLKQDVFDKQTEGFFHDKTTQNN